MGGRVDLAQPVDGDQRVDLGGGHRACPSSSCTTRTSAPPSSRWVANECRSVCGEISSRDAGPLGGRPQHRPGALPRQPAAAGVEEQRRRAAPGRRPRAPAGRGRGRPSTASRAYEPTGTTRSLPPLPRSRTVPASRSRSSTSRPTASEIRAPGAVEQLQQRPVAQRPRGVVRPGGDQQAPRPRRPRSPWAAASAAPAAAPRGRVGRRQALAQHEPVEAAHGDDRPGRGVARQRRVLLVALAQRGEERARRPARSPRPAQRCRGPRGARGTGAGRGGRTRACWPRARARRPGGRGRSADLPQRRRRARGASARRAVRRAPRRAATRRHAVRLGDRAVGDLRRRRVLRPRASAGSALQRVAPAAVGQLQRRTAA